MIRRKRQVEWSFEGEDLVLGDEPYMNNRMEDSCGHKDCPPVSLLGGSTLSVCRTPRRSARSIRA